MKIKSERDFSSGVVFVAVGLLFAIGASKYGMGPPCPPEDRCAASLWARLAQLAADPGPGYLPLALGILVALLGAVMLFKSLTIESEGGDPIGVVAWRPLAATVGAVALFGLALEPLGFVATVPLVVVVASLAASEVRWSKVLVHAIALTVVSWAVFPWGLGLALPLWPAFAR